MLEIACSSICSAIKRNIFGLEKSTMLVFLGPSTSFWGARLLLGFKSRPEGPKSQPAALADVKVFGHSTLEDQLAEGQLVSHARPLLWTEFWVRRPSLRDEIGQKAGLPTTLRF